MSANVTNKQKTYRLRELIDYYEVGNRAEGKSPKTIIWYSANPRRFRSYLIGELVNLKMEDVHLNEGFIKVIGEGNKETNCACWE